MAKLVLPLQKELIMNLDVKEWQTKQTTQFQLLHPLADIHDQSLIKIDFN